MSFVRSSAEIQTGNFAVSYPGGTLKPDIHEWTFLIWIFVCLFVFVAFILHEKNPNLLDIQEQCTGKLGKIQSELKLLFGVYYYFLKFVY